MNNTIAWSVILVVNGLLAKKAESVC